MKYYLLLKAFLFSAFFISHLNAHNATTTIILSNSVNASHPSAISSDNAGNIWVTFNRIAGADRFGLGKYNGSNWEYFSTTNSGIPSNYVTSIDISNDNVIWIGTSEGLGRFDGTNWTHFHSGNSPIQGDTVFTVKVRNNIVWAGTKNGVSRFDGTNWENFNTSNSALASNHINAIEFHNAKLYVGTSAGLSVLADGSWTTYNVLNSGLFKNGVFALQADGNGDIWIGTDSIYQKNNTYAGLYRLSGNTIEPVQEIFTPCNFNLLPNDIRSLSVSTKGNLLIVGYPKHTHTRNIQLLEVTSTGIISYYINPDYRSGAVLSTNNTSLVLHADKMGAVWITAQPNSKRELVKFEPAKYELNTTSQYLDINKVRALIHNQGDMFWDLHGKSVYEVPKGSCINTIFSTALWVGGLDQGNNLHMAANTYRQSGVDFWPGPLDTINAKTDNATSLKYDRIWKVNRTTIEKFLMEYALGNVQNNTYKIPEEILSWPAHGEGAYARNLAPFVDVDNDGIYDPYKGDHPKIKGDQMLFWIFNDNLHPHGESGGRAFGIEVHGSAYSFYCDTINPVTTKEAINLTTFYNFRIINRSDSNYHSVYLGVWSDADIGYPYDDYVGSSPVNNMAYIYNSSNYDPYWEGYGSSPPALSYVILKGPEYAPGLHSDMTGFISYSKGVSPGDRPDKPEDYYNYLRSKWINGDPLIRGGNGRVGNFPPTRFMYDGNPLTGSGWSEVSENNPANDKMMLLSSGPVQLASKGEISIDYAIVYAREMNAHNGHLRSVAKNIEYVKQIQQWFDFNSFPTCAELSTGTFKLPPPKSTLKLFPNPVNNNIVLDYSPVSTMATYNVIDIKGRVIASGPLDNTAQFQLINVSNLSSGMYLMRVVDGSSILNQKFIKE